MDNRQVWIAQPPSSKIPSFLLNIASLCTGKKENSRKKGLPPATFWILPELTPKHNFTKLASERRYQKVKYYCVEHSITCKKVL